MAYCIDNGPQMVCPGQLEWFEFERWLESAHTHDLEVFGKAKRPLQIQVRDRRPPPEAVLRPRRPVRPTPPDGMLTVPNFQPGMGLYIPRSSGRDPLPPPRKP